MATSHHDADMENRFSTRNSDPLTERVMFDVSALPVGHLIAAEIRNSDEDGSDGGFSTSRQFDGEEFDEESRGQDQPNNVTLPSREEAHVPATEDSLIAGTEWYETTTDGSLQLDVSSTLLEASLEAPRERRFRFSYSKKYFYASSELYLQTDPTQPTPDVLPELLGRIMSCPTHKRNNNQYKIQWIRPRDGGTWPTNLTPHLKIHFPKTLLHAQLAFLMGECSLNQNYINAPPPSQTDGMPLTAMLLGGTRQ
jgi:hypothetical protein